MEGPLALLATVVWWATVIGAVYYAGQRGRNRVGWLVLALFAGLTPITGAICVALAARSKRKATRVATGRFDT